MVLHDPRGPATQAEVLLLVSGNTDTAAREKIFEEVARRLPELLNGLRLRSVQAGMASPYDQAHDASPFGGTVGGGGGAAPGYDPFGGPQAPMGGPGVPVPAGPADPFGGGAPAAPHAAPAVDPHEATQHAMPTYNPGARVQPPDPHEVTQHAPVTYNPGAHQPPPPQRPGPPGDTRRGQQLPPAPQGPPPQRYDSDPFDPFGGGA
ncbi:hypothetical protein [Mycolicibacterium mageritense]|uniref:hypothetical protein n=1 Tax=Mycolicibacterium mageritense TaxID=53462 RepID=UPI001E55E053|nr:hypothetical protein [Mycolicibacterium mageritense]MCC9185092.1 hypothetical protein [Mycolicibacterium mageritense]